jgi:hypothetical protein
MSNEGLRKCPFCAELVKVEARMCRYCQKDLPSSELALTKNRSFSGGHGVVLG